MSSVIDPWLAWWGVIIASTLFTIIGTACQLKGWND